MSIRVAQTYLLPQSHTFWEWDLEERSVHWLTGTTIAFPQELATVLARFAVRGLPRFDCVLLVLAALRDSWSPFNKNLESDKLQLDCYKTAMLSDVESLLLIHQLDRLNALPRELRLSIGVKTIVCDMVFELASSRRDDVTMELVLSGLLERREDVPSQEILSIPSERLHDWKLDLISLCRGLERIDEKRLRSRIATGLDEPVQPAEELAKELLVENFSDAMEARELMATLLQDQEHHSLGRLAKDLLAAFYRPAPMVPKKSPEMEGYSDITNRGTVDRLLLSELAYDNDTLAVRIANGEALYMRREVPPNRESLDRFILVDCGIRSWGTPRVYNAAIALALTASAQGDSKVVAWRAMDGELKRSFFVDQSGLTEHMGALDAGLHPGPVLDAFYEQMATWQSNMDVYLVLSRDAWNDRDFRTALVQSKLTRLTAAVVDRFGALELISYSRSGSTTIKKVALTLKESQRPSKPTPVPLIANDKLPQIFGCNPFPLRLSLSYTTFHAVDNRLLLAKAHGKRLVLWDNVHQGAVTLLSNYRSFDVSWAGRDADRQVLFVVCKDGTSNKYTVFQFSFQDYSMLERSEIELKSEATFFSIQGSWLIIGDSKRRQLQAWSIGSGSLIDTFTSPALVSNNLFKDEKGNWMAVHFNGLGFDVNPVSFKQNLGFDISKEKIIFAMVAPKKDGYVAITSLGRMLHSKGSDTPIPKTHLSKCLDECFLVLGDNRWIHIGTESGTFLVEVKDDGTPGECMLDKTSEYDWFSQRLAWGMQSSATVASNSYRNRFHRVAVVNGVLTLLRNQRALILQKANCSLCWAESPLVFREALKSEAKFENDRDLTREAGFRLEVAHKNHVEVMLDARGLLHIRSRNSVRTEITLTITDGLASGWTSDGRWFGSPYYFGKHANTASDTIFEEVLRPLLEQFAGGLL